MATTSSTPVVNTSNELSIGQLVEKISKREELQSKYPYLTKFEDATVPATPKPNSTYPPADDNPAEIEGGEPTHGSVKSRFSILPPIPAAEGQSSTESGGSDGYAATDTSVSLSEFVQISRSNSRACDCTSPCVHQVLQNTESVSWNTSSPGDTGQAEPGGSDTADVPGRTASADSKPGVSGSSLRATDANQTNDSQPVGREVIGASDDTNGDADGENSNSENIDTDMVGLLPAVAKTDGSNRNDNELSSAQTNNVLTTNKLHPASLPPIEANKSSPSPKGVADTADGDAQVVKVKKAGSEATRNNVQSSGSDIPRSDRASVESTGSSTFDSRKSCSSSSASGGYVPSSQEPKQKKKVRRKTMSSPQPNFTSQLPVVSLRGARSAGQFPQVQSPNIRPGSELSNVPYRHRLTALSSESTSSLSGSGNTPATHSKVIVSDDPSIRDNISMQHLKALQNQIEFTSSNASVHGYPLGAPEEPLRRPVTANGVVGLDRGAEFKGEDDASIIDAVSEANGSATTPKNNGLPGKFRYVKVSQPKKGNFSLKNILSKSAKKKKKNALEDSPDADKPVMKAKDDAWLTMDADDVSFPAAFLASSRRPSEEDLSKYDMHSLETVTTKEGEPKQESKKSLLSKFKHMLKPKSKVKKFTTEASETPVQPKQTTRKPPAPQPQSSVHIQDGSNFLGALLPADVSGQGGPPHLGGIKAQGSSNKQQQRPHFVRHMKQMQTKARETSRQSYMSGQPTGDNQDPSRLAESGPASKELQSQMQQGQFQQHQQTNGAPGQQQMRWEEEPKMYFINVAGERLLVVDPDQLPLHDQIVMDPNNVMYRDPSNDRVYVPPNTPHADATDFYNEDSDLYNVRGNDRVLAALQNGGVPPNTPLDEGLTIQHADQNGGEYDSNVLQLQYGGVEYLIQGEIPPELLAMTQGDLDWVAEESTPGGRRSAFSRMGTSLQVIKEEEEPCTESEFGDDEASVIAEERCEPDGESSPSVINGPTGAMAQSSPGTTDSGSSGQAGQPAGRVGSALQRTERPSSNTSRGATLLGLVHSRENSARQRTRNHSTNSQSREISSATRREAVPDGCEKTDDKQGEGKPDDMTKVSTAGESNKNKDEKVDDAGTSKPVPGDTKTQNTNTTASEHIGDKSLSSKPVNEVKPFGPVKHDNNPTTPVQNGVVTTASQQPNGEINPGKKQEQEQTKAGTQIAVARPPSNLSVRKADQIDPVDGSKLTVPTSVSKSTMESGIDRHNTRPVTAKLEGMDRPMTAASERKYTSLEAAHGVSDTSTNKSDGDSGIESTPKPETDNKAC